MYWESEVANDVSNVNEVPSSFVTLTTNGKYGFLRTPKYCPDIFKFTLLIFVTSNNGFVESAYVAIPLDLNVPTTKLSKLVYDVPV